MDVVLGPVLLGRVNVLPYRKENPALIWYGLHAVICPNSLLQFNNVTISVKSLLANKRGIARVLGVIRYLDSGKRITQFILCAGFSHVNLHGLFSAVQNCAKLRYWFIL